MFIESGGEERNGKDAAHARRLEKLRRDFGPVFLDALNLTIQPAQKLTDVVGASLSAFIFVLSLLVVTSSTVLALNGVWLPDPGSGVWNIGTNWSTSPNAPVNPGDTATFNTSRQTSLNLFGGVTVESITFQPGASVFTINTTGNLLFIQGAGIVNNSGQTQTITNNFHASGGGTTEFFNTATAGDAAIINNGGPVSGAGGFTEFFNTATAGNAAITNNGVAVSGGGGFTEFFNTATAGNAAITNNGAAVSGGMGFTEFFNTATAGNAAITNNGAAVSSAAGGTTEFLGTSTAGSATIINNGGTGGGGGGVTLFINSSDGGTARAITNGNGGFDISGLTTASMGIGSIEGSGNYFLGSKTLTVGRNNLSTTVSGVIQDGGFFGGASGSLTKVGTGTLTLTGANTYSGGTNFNAGILAVTRDSNLGTGALTFNGGTMEALGGVGGGGITSSKAVTLNAGGGTFLADTGTFSTLIGNIIGTGSFIKAGPGELTFTGANTYSGGTTITAGTLQIGSGGTIGSIVGKVIDNGTLAFNRSDSVAFAGAISGAGNLVQLGGGTLVLTGNGTYTGGTTISAGTLQIGSGGTTGSIIGNVTNNGTFVFDRSDSVTFSGVISGAGSLVQQGAGTLTLPNPNTYKGTTTVKNGSLIVDGSIASAQTVVNSGAFLGGHGTIGGDLVNNGTVAQINSPGTLTVAGNYTQNAGGTLKIAVGGLAPSQHDLLAVNGQATIAGNLQLIQLGGFNLQPGDQVTFLTAKKGVSGIFSNQNGLVSTGTLVQAQVTTLPNSVVLEGIQGSIANTPGVVRTPNEASVAKALDSAAGDPRAAALFAFLNSQPLANLPNDLNLISPQQLGSFHATGSAQGNTQIASLSGRMANIRAGSTGFSSAGFTINGSAASFGEGLAGVSGPEGKGGPAVFAPTPENRWGVFVTGIGEFTNVGSTPNATGYDVSTGGFTLGVDYRVCPFFALGLTAGYANSGVNLDARGDINVNSGKLGFYATAFDQGFYLDTAVSGGPSGYDSHRTALQGTASGNTNGGNLDVLVAAGYDWKLGGLSIGPIASFQYGYIGINAFTETSSLAPLKFPDQNFESERTGFGLRTSYEWKIGYVTLIPEIRTTWQHEYGDTAFSIVAGLASGAGNNFTVTSAPIGRDSIAVGAGVSVIWNERVSTYLYYDGEFARTNYQYNAVSGGVRITF